ncbi:small multidrug efflux protein [Microbacterium sp. EST19A]|uniref:small multidrug efflux protein n=1 Tax=Microbacterium sp. EST19A TaxID=2862681 RepID=UPI001CBDC147|nr:small multidrug efflux protein [Microbacterium sp. EST19A]
MDNPYPWLQDFINQVPEFLQPVMVALVAAIPYIEGEGAAAFGIIAGINPIVAAVAAATGNILCVIAVVLLGSRIRGGVVARRAARAEAQKVEATNVGAGGSGLVDSSASATATATTVAEEDADAPTNRRSKGRAKLRGWLVRFGVPGASILAPIALPTMLTAAFFVASGVRKEWVILWQIIAIVLWTGAVAAAATGVLALLGW